MNHVRDSGSRGNPVSGRCDRRLPSDHDPDLATRLGADVASETWTIRVVVLTQACDLAQDKTTRVVVAPVHEAAELVARNILKAGAIRDQVRRGQVFGWYFLPAASAPINLAESIVDLRELHTIERRTLEYLVGAGKRFAAFGPLGVSTWPSISAPPTCGLPCPNRMPPSRDSPGGGILSCVVVGSAQRNVGPPRAPLSARSVRPRIARRTLHHWSLLTEGAQNRLFLAPVVTITTRLPKPCPTIIDHCPRTACLRPIRMVS